MLKRIGILLCALVSCASLAMAQGTSSSSNPASTTRPASTRGDITGAVTDSSTAQPLPTIEIAIKQDERFVAGTFTDAFGRFTVHNLSPGNYTVTARIIGYRAETRTVEVVAGKEGVELAFQMVPVPLELGRIEVSATAPTVVDVRSGDQHFQESQYHGAPTTTTSQILQQSMAGAVRAPTGEVHIRGQHAEYTYYVDGVPVQSGVSGSLNELFDPSIISAIAFKTGGWDAEYGNKNTAIIDVATRIPAGGAHLDLSGYGGSFDANGESFSASANGARLGAFISGARQVSDMRVEPVMFDPANDKPINFHNRGEDLSGFGKMQYIPHPSDIFGLDANYSRTRFDVPYDSTGGTFLDDGQEDFNAFTNLSWRHRSDIHGEAGEATRETFAALIFRAGGLKYNPGAADDPQFVFFPDPTAYNLHEKRDFHSVGAKLDYIYKPRHELELKTGAQGSVTGGHEDFSTVDAGGQPGPAANSDLTGCDIGVYAQGVISPSDRLEIRPGVRFDAHRAPFAGTRTQVSPRIRLSLFPDAGNSFWLYYGRLFIPTNIEDLRAVTSVADSGVVTEPTLPERDDFYEVGYVHRFPAGVVTKLSAYYKSSSPESTTTRCRARRSSPRSTSPRCG